MSAQYPWIPPRNTSNDIARQSETTYANYNKIKGFEDVGYFLEAYVVSGGAATKNVTRNDTVDVTDIVVSLNNDIMQRSGASFQTRIPATTYYLDFTADGDWSWGTAHPSGVSFLPIVEVTTAVDKNVASITDVRGVVGGFRLKSTYGLDGFVSTAEFEDAIADVETQMNTLVTKGSVQINVRDYGAVGNSFADDTAAINRAISALIAKGGGTLYIPAGTYRVTSSLMAITVSAEIVGDGALASKLLTNIDGVNVITIDAYFCRVAGLEIAYSGTTPSSGSGVFLKDQNESTVERCNIHGFYINIDTLDAAYWTIFNNQLYDPVKYNIRVQNTHDPDEGDSQIMGNLMITATNPNIDAHIYQLSSGGLRVVSNKFLYGKTAVKSAIVDGVITSILLIMANSLEHQTEAFVYIKRSNTSGKNEFVSITGNEFRSDIITAGIVLDDGTDTASITGNVIIGQSTGTAIVVNNRAKDVAIVGNTFRTWETGIKINFAGGNSARATINSNQFSDDVMFNFKNTGYIQDSAIENNNDYTNNVIALDNVTYKNVYQVDISTYSGGVLELDIFGIISGTGSFSRRITKILNREGAGITLTNISDTAGGAAIDVNFDVATTPGSVIVQVRKASTAGTTLNGTVAIQVKGDVTAFKAFDTV